MQESKNIIMIVDDDRAVLESLAEYFQDEYQVISASCGKDSIDNARNNSNISCVILDIKMAEMDGIETSRHLGDIIPETPVIFHTGYPGDYKESEIDRKEKPFDYIVKGLSLPALVRSVRNAVKTYELKMNVRRLLEVAEKDYKMIGRSKIMQDIFKQINNAALSDQTIMLLGETGSGKGMAAAAIHYNSRRKVKPFKTFDCNHTPKDLVESTLFGHIKGAFSGAIADNQGLLEYADGGTVFLDEIGDLSKESQGKLLRFLDSGKIDTVGYTGPDKIVDVRIICATNKNLSELVQAEAFREDLYYRLEKIRIALPTLNERREDIPLLVESRLDYIAEKEKVMRKFISQNAVKCLASHNWRGNVRQLHFVIDSLAATVDNGLIREEDVRARLSLVGLHSHHSSATLDDQMDAAEKTFIINALIETKYNISAAARLLEIDNASLHRKLKKHGVDVSVLK